MTNGIWAVDGMFFLAVLAMAGATYALRAGGYWVMGRVPITARMRRGLEALPGAIIVSTILPIALKGGVPAAVCLFVAASAMALIRRDIVAVALAVAAAALVRAGGFG